MVLVGNYSCHYGNVDLVGSLRITINFLVTHR